MSDSYIKNVSSKVVEVVDSETGELLSVSEKKVEFLVENDKFCFVYASFWNTILDSNLNRSDIELLCYLLDNYSDGVPFSISKYIKEIVAKRAGKSITSYNNSTRSLLKYDFIIKCSGANTYILNPKLAFKGSSKERNKRVVFHVRNGDIKL